MTSSLETLLRESTLSYGHIQLFRDDAGWQASVCHYEPTAVSGVTINSKVSSDPVNALTAALLEDERRCRDEARRYQAAEKLGDVPEREEKAPAKSVEVSNLPVREQDEFEDLFS